MCADVCSAHVTRLASGNCRALLAANSFYFLLALTVVRVAFLQFLRVHGHRGEQSALCQIGHWSMPAQKSRSTNRHGTASHLSLSLSLSLSYAALRGFLGLAGR